MLVELSVVEQKYQAVLAVIGDGREVTDVARQFGVSRQTLHAWLGRYEAEGLAGLAPRSRRPSSRPNQMDPAVEVLVLEMRRAHPHWGPRRLLHELAITASGADRAAHEVPRKGWIRGTKRGVLRPQ